MKPAADLLNLLVCPVTRLPLSYDADRQVLVTSTGREYLTRDGVPLMLVAQD